MKGWIQNMDLYDSGQKLTKDIIKRFENILGLSLPDDYKEFMMKTNGGTPEEDLAYGFIDVVTNKTNDSDLRELFVFYEDEENDNFDDIMRIYKSMVNEKLIPPFFFPIGDDSGGDPLCMNLSQEEYGSIWFCDHELENSETGFLAASKIANSFTEFLDLLYEMTFDGDEDD